MPGNLTLPEPDVPLVDPKTGRINDHWYIQLKRLLETLNALVP